MSKRGILRDEKWRSNYIANMGGVLLRCTNLNFWTWTSLRKNESISVFDKRYQRRCLSEFTITDPLKVVHYSKEENEYTAPTWLYQTVPPICYTCDTAHAQWKLQLVLIRLLRSRNSTDNPLQNVQNCCRRRSRGTKIYKYEFSQYGTAPRLQKSALTSIDYIYANL